MDATSKQVSQIIEGLYDAACGQAEWLTAVEQMRVLFDGSQACFAHYDPDPRLAKAVSTRPSDALTQRFFDYGPKNEILVALDSANVGDVYHDHAVIGFHAMRSSALWNEWMRPQDMYGSLSSKLMVGEQSVSFFDVHRGPNQEPFDKAEVEMLERLVPHLMHAGRINLKIAETAARALDFLPFGHIVVDGYQRIVSTNAAAEALFAQPDSPLTARSGYLASADGTAAARLRDLIVDACRLDRELPGTGGEMAIRTANRDAFAGVVLSIFPLAGAQVSDASFGRYATIFVREISLSVSPAFAEHIRTVFALTPAEARLAAALASGLALKEVAADANLSFGTARRYLEKVFRKTGTRQQSQLVALLKSAEPFR